MRSRTEVNTYSTKFLRITHIFSVFRTLFHQLLPWWLRRYSVCLHCGRPGFDPWVGKIPWRRKWQSTPVLLPGKSHGQRSLVGYSPWGRKELDTTERLHFHFPFPFINCYWKQEDHWLVLGNTLIK